jgi:putative DNA primase/helicase
MSIETKFIHQFADALSHLGGVGADDKKAHPETEAMIAAEMAIVASNKGFRRGEGTLFLFNGIKYDKLDREDIEILICGTLETLNIGKVYQMKSVEGIYKRMYRSMHMKKFVPQRTIIAFRNKVLNLKDMSTSKHSSEQMTRIYLDFDYDKNATCHEWDRFLVDVIPDKGSRLILQEFLGLMFVDNNELSIEASMFIYGTGSNGKGVIQYIMDNMLGEYCSGYTLAQLCSNNDAGYNLADANGKLLNYASDMDKKIFSNGIFKQIAAREPIQVRQVAQAPFKATDMPLLISNINEIPETTDMSHGFWRRFKLVHLPKTILDKDQDRTLKMRLLGEISGIFNWIISGRERILAQRGQFTESRYMDNMVKDIRTEANSVWSFMSENRYISKIPVNTSYYEVKLLTRDLIKDYHTYCLDNGNKPKAKKGFIADLKHAGFEYRESLRVNGQVSSGFIAFKVEEQFSDVFGQPTEDDEDTNFSVQNNDLPF